MTSFDTVNSDGGGDAEKRVVITVIAMISYI